MDGAAARAPTTSPSARAWKDAAERLARKTTGRERAGALLRATAAGLACGAVAAAVLRLLPLGSTSASLAALVAAGTAGAAIGARAALRVRPTSRSDAAWALDRLAGAKERGLSAALLDDVGADTALAGLPAPPAAPLHPPAGLAALVGAALLAVGALTIPAAAPRADGSDDSATGPKRRPAGATEAIEAGRADAAADRQARRASAERAVREALALAPDGPLQASEVAERLRSAQALDAARHAAAADPDLAKAVAAAAAGDDAGSEAVAAALSTDAAARAESLRREAAARRAAAGPSAAAFVPVSRRDVVERYLQTRLAGGERDAGPDAANATPTPRPTDGRK